MDESASPHGRHLVVFIHGFHDSSNCWEKLISLLREDPRFAHYDLATYDYPTKLLSARWLRRIPSLKELGRGLASFLEPRLADPYVDLTLVGHSMGRLVIQSALLEFLNQGHGEDLRQVRQVVFLATPNLGSGLANTLRKFLYTFVPNAQEHSLRLLDPEVHDLLCDVQKRIVTASERTAHECPIAIHAFWGQQDGIVGQASARALFPNSSPLPGDHSGIIRPNDRIEDHYTRIASAILEPSGHQEVFEVEEFQFLVKVEPRPPNSFTASHGAKRRKIRTDNVATVTQEVRFSRKNRRTHPYRLAYATQNNGFVNFKCSHENIAPPFVVGHWEDYGTSAEFHFRPSHQEAFSIVAEVFGGFNQQSCDITQHLDGRSRIKRYVFHLDLSGYLESGRQLRKEPTLCVLRRNTRKSAISFERTRVPTLPVSSSGPGVWTWELHHLHEGMIDVRWELDETPQPHKSPTAAI